MTGLDYNVNKICEIACIITEADLTVVDELSPIIIGMSKEDLVNMNAWCKKTFKKNGLLEKIQNSQITTAEAEEKVLQFLQKHTEKFTCALAGNSVNMDRVFIEREMPKVAKHFHYRTVDVSSFKEMIRRWYPQHFNSVPKKALLHRSLDDIRESIEELRWYHENFFKKSDELNHLLPEFSDEQDSPSKKKSRSSDDI
uniref:Exonuclease domain-containing protein n=1 Tax=Acrobeloides nanus TaxID=290746 RepID=A0A914ENC6_9BILA